MVLWGGEGFRTSLSPEDETVVQWDPWVIITPDFSLNSESGWTSMVSSRDLGWRADLNATGSGVVAETEAERSVITAMRRVAEVCGLICLLCFVYFKL